MTTMTPTTDAILTQLQARLDALGTLPEFAPEHVAVPHRRHWDAIQRVITGIKDAPDQIARAQSRLDDVEARSAAVLAKQRELEQALDAAPDVTGITDHHARAKEEARQGVLQRQLQLLRNGELWKAPGVVFERLVDLDARIKELTDRRDRAQNALDGYLKTAEALLTVTV